MRAIEPRPLDRQRQKIIGFFASRPCFDDRKFNARIALGDRNGKIQACSDPLAFVPEPPPAEKKRRDHIALQHISGMPLHQRRPAVVDHKRLEFRRDTWGVDAWPRFFAELEPIKTVGRERHDIRILSDPREVRATQHLKWSASPPI